MKARWMRIGIGALVAMASLVPAAGFAQTPATPQNTPTVAATASADGALRRSDALPAAPGIRVFTDAQTFEGGLQVGTTAAGATAVSFLKRVKCTINPVALAAVTGIGGASEIVRCPATGALPGDFAACTLPTGSASGVVLKSATTGTDYVDMELTAYGLYFTDAGTVAIQCLVVR